MFGEKFHHKFVIYIYMFNKEMIHITLIVFIVEIVEADPEEEGVTLSPLANLDRPPTIADPTSLVQRKMISRYKLSDVVFIRLINIKMPTIVGILRFMSRKNFILR